ncbi:MAG: serine hydrolase domain-containing protein [Anaerolineae bacterium]
MTQNKKSSFMTGGRPSVESLVTLDNWFIGEPVSWSFKNMSQLVPCAEAHRGIGQHQPLEAGEQALDLNSIHFTDLNQKNWTVTEMLSHTHTDGFLVVHNEKIVSESYFDLAPHQRHLLQSVSKSLTACLAAVFIEKGVLDVTRTVSSYMPEYEASAYGGATVQQVLDMTAAIGYTEEYEDMASDVNLHTIAGGWYGPKIKSSAPESIPVSLYDYLPTLIKPANFKHGEVFHYVSANTDVLGVLLEKIGGKPFTKLFEEHIWQYMGADENAAMTVDPWGCAFPCGGFNLTLRDLARFGLMCLGDGHFNGRQIVPKSFFDDIQQNGDPEAFRRGSDYAEFMPNAAYRNQFWKTGNTNNAFFGVGIHGQYIYIDPAAEVIIAKLSSHPKPLVDENSKLTLLAFAAIVQKLDSATR